MRQAGTLPLCSARNSYNVEQALLGIFHHPPRIQHRWMHSTRTLYNEALSASTRSNVSNVGTLLRDTKPGRLSKREERTFRERHVGNIDPSSLPKTLQRHRDANQDAAPIIRKFAARSNIAAGLMRPESVGSELRKSRQILDNREGKHAKQAKVNAKVNAASRIAQSSTDLHTEYPIDRQVEEAWFAHLNLDTSQNVGEQDRNSNHRTRMQNKPWVKNSLDYQGRYVLPIERETRDAQELPWYVDNGEVNGIARLDREIAQFYNFSQSTAKETEARDRVVENIQIQIRDVLPDYTTEVFRTNDFGLGTTQSDILIRVYSSASELESPRPRTTALKDVGRMLKALQANFRYRDSALTHTDYPSLSTTHDITSLTINIVLSDEELHEPKWIQRYIHDDPDLSPLLATLRAMLDVRGLTSESSGGLNLYTLGMMAATSLQLHNRGYKSVGEKLLDFMDIYGGLDLYKEAITVDPPAKFGKVYPGYLFDSRTRKAMAKDTRIKSRYDLATIHHLEPYLLCIQDPGAVTYDLGAHAFAIKHIQQTILRLKGDLDDRICDPPRGTPYTLLGPLLADSCSRVLRMRKGIEQFCLGRRDG